MPKDKQNTPYLYVPPDSSEINELEDKFVLRCLETIKEGKVINEDREEGLEQVQIDMDNAFSTEEPDGQLFMESKLSYTVVKKGIERMDFLNFDIDIIPELIDLEKEDKIRKEYMKMSNLPPKEAETKFAIKKLEKLEQDDEDKEFREAYMKAGIQEIMRLAGFSRIMQQKGGVFSTVMTYGDAFVTISEINGDFPIRYDLVLSENVYIQSNAVSMRESATGQDVTRLAIAYPMDYDYYMTQVVPNIRSDKNKAEKASWGFLPESEEKQQFNESDAQYGEMTMQRRGELVVYYDLEMMKMGKVVGNQGAVIESFEESKWPAKVEGKPVIPIAHFLGLPSQRGFHNWGLGHYMSQLNNVNKIIENKTVIGAIKEVDPLQYIQGKPGGRGEFEALVYRAEQDISEGRHGIIYDEPDDNNQYSTNPVQTLSGKAVSNVGDIAQNVIEQSVIDLGIGLQEVQTEAEKTATAVAIEQETANFLVREVNRRNANEYKFLIQMTIEIAKRLIKPNNRMRIDTSNVQANTPEQRLFLRLLTLGKVVEELKNIDYKVTMDVMSGVIPNPVLEITRLGSAYQMTGNRPINDKILQKLISKQTGIHVSLKDLKMQQQEGGGQAPLPNQVPVNDIDSPTAL